MNPLNAIEALGNAVIFVVGALVMFVKGVLTEPATTLRLVGQGLQIMARSVAKSARYYASAMRVLVREFNRQVPLGLRLALLVLASLFVGVLYREYTNMAARRAARADAMRRFAEAERLSRAADGDDLSASDSEATHSPRTSLTDASDAAGQRKASDDGVWGRLVHYVMGTTPTPATPAEPQWRYDMNDNHWKWATPSQRRRRRPRTEYDESDSDSEMAPPNRRWKPAHAVDELDEDTEGDAVKRDLAEAEQLKQRVEDMKEADRLSELRAVVAELRQKRKLRQQIQNEYEWADEQDARRELERERKRAEWHLADRRYRRLVKARFGDVADEVDQRAADPDAETGTDGEEDQAQRRSCTKPPRKVPTYGEFMASGNVAQNDYAYVTYVSSSEYVQGAAVLMHSIALTGSQYARAVVVTKDVGAHDRALLSKLARVIEIDRVSHPHFISNAHYRDTFTKLRIWQLVMFRKVVYIDVDVIILRNLDDLFDLDEWSVPMDAEQNRYSTGMMVLEPLAETFDDMMKKLQTTTVSMELPDLLFLKEYFDTRGRVPKPTPAGYSSWYAPPAKPAGPPINIIPRWYQVYQEEFGSQYSTYLTGRRQKITIYDRRIHGIHYPGNDKPWNSFGDRVAKFQKAFCYWRHAEEFVYEPRFLWYLHFTWMKHTLARAERSIAFEHEAGGGEIKLSDVIAEMTATPKPTPPSQYRYQPYGDRPAYEYNSAPRKPGDDNVATMAPPTLDPAGEQVWLPEWCLVARDRAHVTFGSVARQPGSTSTMGSHDTSTTATSLATSAPSSTATATAAHISTTAAPATTTTTAAQRQLQQATTSAASAGSDSSSSSGDSGAGAKSDRVVFPVVDLTPLQPVAVQLPQRIGRSQGSELYSWVVSWCTKRKLRAASDSSCGQPAHVSQYSGGLCRANFYEHASTHLLRAPSGAVLGVVLRSSVTLENPTRTKVMEVVVRCDWSIGEEATALLDHNATAVVIDDLRKRDDAADRRYTIRLRARCACAGGCGAAKMYSEVVQGSRTPSAAVDTQARRWSAQKFGSASAPFPRRGVFRRCFGLGVTACVENPACDYSVGQRRCRPTMSAAWIKFRDATRRQFSNCTHIGGDGTTKVTASECLAKAVLKGANVVNFNPWDGDSAATATGTPASTTATPAAASRKPGCYFKKCRDRSLYQGVPSVKTATGKDEQGFDVYFKNPFHMSDEDAAEFEKLQRSSPQPSVGTSTPTSASSTAGTARDTATQRPTTTTDATSGAPPTSSGASTTAGPTPSP